MAHRAALIVVSYSPLWPQEFETERVLIQMTIASSDLCLEHIGSTAIPGVSAKPIIDMMIGAPSLQHIEKWVPLFEHIGYEYMPEHEQFMPERRFLAKPRIRPRHFHLHGAVVNSPFWHEHLAFRNALRHNSKLAAQYSVLKQQLAEKFGDDREGYTNAKGPFISSVIKNVAARGTEG
jgi:GrpB-like predicted nucleotidyltransferase (UPF0157 family)